jgi:hypothetical protein
MPDFDPQKHDGWSLREALMRAGNPVLALMAQKRLELGKQPHWWMPPLAPQPLSDREIEYDVHPERDYLNPERDYNLIVQAVETAFRIKLINGDFVCWARPGAPHESHTKLARGAWGALVVEDWIFGTLRACTRDAHMDFVPVPEGPRYYDARIEPWSNEGEAASPANIEAWYRGYVKSGAPLSERAEVEAAEKHFGRAISRGPFREMRRRVLLELRPDLQDEEQPSRLRSGRRGGNCAGK